MCDGGSQECCKGKYKTWIFAIEKRVDTYKCTGLKNPQSAYCRYIGKRYIGPFAAVNGHLFYNEVSA